MEGRDRQALALAAAQQRADALFHFPRGLVGEGHGDDVTGLDAAFLDQVGDLAGDHAGLAGARAGKHQERAADVVHGFLLPGIESGHGRRISLRRRAGILAGTRPPARAVALMAACHGLVISPAPVGYGVIVSGR